MKTADTEMETVKRVIEINIADCDGNAIHAGNVLQSLERPNERGVVMRILKEGDRGYSACHIGDMEIKIGPGTTCFSTRYNQWKIIPHNEQTYEERYDAWFYSEVEPDYDEEPGGVTRAEAVAIQGIMALLPDDIVDWDFGPFPNRLENALSFLVAHLSSISDSDKNKKRK